MEKKNFNMIISAVTFIAGGAFVLSNSSDINANVIGASGTGATITAVVGIVLVVASAGFFVLTMNLEKTLAKEKYAAHPEHEHHAEAIKEDANIEHEQKP